MNLRTETGKPYFYQWDTDQILIVEDAPTCREVHFCHRGDTTAMVCGIREADGKRVADVPNILLQQDKPIMAYLFSRAEDNARTQQAWEYPVLSRPKPEEYVYTQTEVLSYASLDERVKALETDGVSDEKVAEIVEGYLVKNPVTETDPTVPIWAKADTKPTYTAAEVGALPASTVIPEAVTDEHINSLIDAKLEVIENGTY